MYDNIWADLDDSPSDWHYQEPCDPTEYQNELPGDVINIY